jgi:hypothetical protein
MNFTSRRTPSFTTRRYPKSTESVGLPFYFPNAPRTEKVCRVHPSNMTHRVLRSWLIFSFLLFSLTGCQTIRHQFLGPSSDWQARNGQLLYRGKRTTLIGEVLVRFSKTGDLELTFTKGPGFILLELRQDANFASVKGPLARGAWSGPNNNAPPRLQGWLQLREVLMASTQQPSVQHKVGNETFIFRF